MSNLLKYIWLPSIVAITIFYLCCLIPSKNVPYVELDFFIPADKIVHFLMYLGLSGIASFNYIYIRKGHIIILKLVVFAILIPILYGGLIEIIQAEYFPERSGDWFDFLADSLGSLTALPFALWFRKYLLNKQLREENI